MKALLKALRRIYLIMLIVTISCQTTVLAADVQDASVGLSGPVIAIIAAGGVILVGAIIAVIVALVRRNKDN